MIFVCMTVMPLTSYTQCNLSIASLYEDVMEYVHSTGLIDLSKEYVR